MNEKQRNTYLAWLSDAHALEEGLIKVLERQIQNTRRYMPEAVERRQQHLEETRSHARRIKERIEANGGSVSKAKDWSHELLALLSGFGATFMNDVMMKNVHCTYAAEHLEISTYLTIRAAALEFGDTATAQLCDEIIEEEENMAEWLEGKLPLVVNAHLHSLA